MNLAPAKSEIIAEIIKAYRALGRPFTRREYDEVANIHSRAAERVFGTWTKALEAAGMADKFKKLKELEAEAKAFNPDQEIAKRWETEKQALVKDADERKNRWLRKHVHERDLLKDMLTETLSQADPHIIEVSPIKMPKTGGSVLSHVTLWFEFGDLQLGTCITSEELGGLNKHNWIVWQDKLAVWKTWVKERIASYSKTHVIDRVVINCLGDMVEGVDIFAGQAWQVDKDVVDQALYGANDTAAAFIEIFLTFPSIKFDVLEVFGNHGRIGRKGENPYSCSMDKIYQRFVEIQIKAIKEVKNCNWHQNEAWFYLVSIYGWNHLNLHGNQGISGLWGARPTINGLEKGVIRYAQMLQSQIHFVHAGHFHSEMQATFNMCQVLLNGSWVGTSTFSAQQMVAASPPMQTMHVFGPRVGLENTERCYLTSGTVLNPIEPVLLN